MLGLKAMVKAIAFFLLFFYIIFSLPGVVLAQESQTETKTKVEVDHVANVLEKFREKVTLFFKFSKEDKYSYQKFLLEKRLAELKYVIDTKQGNLIEETSSRYSTYLGNFTDFVIKNKLTSKKEEILKMYEEHQKILDTLQINFEFESGFWLLLQHDINTVKIFSEQIKLLTPLE